MSKPQALHFGAGNIGRGFIAPLLVEAGYHVIFVDIVTDVIGAINDQGSYNVHIIGTKATKHVSNVSGILSQSDDVIKQLANPATTIVTTAVGVGVLKRIAGTLAKGLEARRKADAGPLNVIACENMVRQTTAFAEWVEPHLSAEVKPWAEKNVGFANCSVDRIVPPGEPTRNTLDVSVEEFHEWVVDETLLRAPIEPKVPGMHLTGNLDAYVERKLFTLNCGHAITAYMGFIKHLMTVDQALEDAETRTLVRGAMEESGAALIKKHNFDSTAHAEYIQSILKRIADPNLADSVERVGRQPLRKLSPGDRLLGPTNLALEYGLPVDNLLRGIASVLLFDVEADEQSVELQNMIKEVGVEKTVAETTGLQEGSKEHSAVVAAYHGLKSKSSQ
jgi:mannitol-1-phosphate 5-dehydrogenase